MKFPEVLLKTKVFRWSSLIILIFAVLCLLFLALFWQAQNTSHTLAEEASQQKKQIVDTTKSLNLLRSQDQYKINQKQQAEINHIHVSYNNASLAYEKLQDIKQSAKDEAALDELYAAILHDLSEKNYASADSQIALLNTKIEADIVAQAPKITTSTNTPDTTTASNNLPADGHSRQKVHTDSGDFVVDIIAANLSSTKVVVDTASDSDCGNNCPVLPLSTFISRNGAYAGINGSYFCPASYPSCAGKTNSFDLLLMNKNKKYFNSDNNVYSTNPAVIFGNGFVRFVTQASQWGRDTSVDGVISNYPLLVSGSNVVYGGGSDPKMGSIGPRSFIANKGNTVYMGFVYNATMTESALVMKALGVDNAMNLDEGGSTALWYNGSYLAGPGRDLANAVLFIKK